MNDTIRKFFQETFLWIILGIILMTACVTALNNDIIAYYSFDNVINNMTIADSSGINNLTNVGNGNNYSISTFSKHGQSLSSLTYNVGITNINPHYFSKSYASANWTINAWIFANSTGLIGGGGFLSIIQNVSPAGYISLYLYSSITKNPVRVQVWENSSYAYYSDFSSAEQKWNVWNMYTLTYNNDTRNIIMYINGQYAGNFTANKTLWMKNYTIGVSLNPFYEDDASVYNTILTAENITFLYNNGYGLNYSETLETTPAVITPLCIDEHTYCNQPVLFQDRISCYYQNTTYCADGCINNMCYNYCGENECNIIGQTQCYDSTNYLTCEDSDGDGCLELQTPTTCSAGTYCVDYFNLAVCENVTANGVHDDYSMIVTPYAVNTENETYFIDASQNSVSVLSTYLIHRQDFYTTGTQYISRVCNYTELDSQSLITSSTIVNQTTYTLTSAVGQNSIVRLDLIPSAYDNGTIEILSQGGVSMSTIKYYRNMSEKSMCIYDNSDAVIVCDYDYTGSDTLKNLMIEYTFDIQHSLYTMKYYFNRTYPQTKNVFPKTLSTNNVAYIRITANGTQFKSYDVRKIPQFTSFTHVNNNTALLNPCNYQNIGVYKVRTYGNNNGIPDYAVYKDYLVNIIGLGLTSTQVTGESDFLNLTDEIKIILSAVFIIFSMALVGGGLGIVSRNGGVSGIGGLLAGLIMGVILSSVGWLPVYIMILVAILDTIAIVIVFKVTFLSSGGVG